MGPLHIHTGADSFKALESLLLSVDGLSGPFWVDEAIDRTEVAVSMNELASGAFADRTDCSHHIIRVIKVWGHYKDGAEFSAVFGKLDGQVLIEDEGDMVFLGLDAFVGPEDEVLSDEKLATFKLKCSPSCSLT
jgi:hypothetical protein